MGRIQSLSGLKVLAVFGVLACHMGVIPAFDACARMVEILFIISGFLMAYNYHEKFEDYSLLSGFKVIRGKLWRFYPVHLITFLLQLFFVEFWVLKPLGFKLSIGALNLSLLHAWFVDTEFSFNNVSWFLSALLFCYLITPGLAGIVKKTKSLWKIFMVIFVVRLFFEYVVINERRYVYLDLHCNPFIQSLNYAMAYILGVSFSLKNSINEYLKEKAKVFEISAIQVLMFLLYGVCCYFFNGGYRIFFVSLGLGLVMVLAYNNGIVSKIFSKRLFLIFDGITLEIFMFHSFILYHFPVNGAKPITYLTFLGITLLVSVLYHMVYIAIRKKILAR
jgi:peptidoglycan/LPS O-acetylase OafA/YrhL